jgi:hypothetical protein
MEEILKLKHISYEISALPEKYRMKSGCFRGANPLHKDHTETQGS